MSGPNGGYATKELILGATDLASEDLFVEEWGATVRIRELTGTERGAFEASVSKMISRDGSTSVEVDANQLRVKLCALTIVDESGRRLFDDTEMAKLGGKSARALQRIFEVSSRLSGISDESMEEALGESEAILQEESS